MVSPARPVPEEEEPMIPRCWAMAALVLLGVGPLAVGLDDARAQWVEVSSVRYGLFGRPRAVERYLVPAVDVVPAGYVVDAPVVATRYVETVPTSYLSAVSPTSYLVRSYPVGPTVYVDAPVARSYYVPSSRVIESRAIYLP
jgi:hypothetical protein